MAASGTTVVKDRVKGVLEGIHLITTTRVMVGIPSDRAGRRDGPITNAALLYIHDNGAPEVGIPARPSVRPGLEDSRDKWEGHIARAGGLAMDGKVDAAMAALRAAGFAAENGIKRKINSNIPPPLAESTLAKRRARKITRTKTLVDMGQMRNAVTHVLRKS